MKQSTRPRLEDIETFVSVAETGSFVQAARHLARDASVLSRRVSALEARLGIRLLTRTTRRITLTEAGTHYLKRVQGVIAELSLADAEAADRAGSARGTLRLALPRTFGRLWIAPLLPRFLLSHPHIKIEARYTDHFVDLVGDGVDVAVRVGVLADSSLTALRLASSRRLLVASPGYLASRGTPSRPEALREHACLGFTGHHFWPDWPLRRGGERVTVRIDGPLTSDDGETLMTAALDGAGITIGSDWLMGRSLADGRLVEVLPGWSVDGDGAIQLLTPPGRLVPGKTRAFSQFARQAFTALPPWELQAGQGQ